jgi:hypothetical protein
VPFVTSGALLTILATSKKLEPMNDKSLAIRVDTSDQNIRNVEEPEADSQSIVQVEVSLFIFVLQYF